MDYLTETIVNVTVTDTLTDTSTIIRTSCLENFDAEHYTNQGYRVSIGEVELNELSHPIPSIAIGLEEGCM